MQAQGFIMDLLRPLFYAIDKIVYGLIEILYNLFAYTSNLTIFSNSDFAAFNRKVYLILGIVMLFKIAFSLISLFANPDELMDSNKGVTGIVKRIIFSLVLITLVPTIFNTAYRIQTIIIQDNVVGNFFLGNLVGDSSSTKEKEKVKKMQQNAGKMVSFSVLSAFYYPESIIVNKYNADGTIDLKDDVKWSSEAKRCIYDNGTSVCKTNEDLMNYIRKETYSIDDYDAFITKDFKNGNDRYYIMHYKWGISTIAGVVVAWIFFGFCFDTAIRAVKLSALQLIAPIPIFSYIDPKKGESIFKNWYTTVISTYVGLFARLVLIYFVIYICCLLEGGMQQFAIDNSGELIITNIGNSNSIIMMGFAKALIIIGLLMFAKDAPKLFSDMFGINMSSSFGMNLAKMGIVGTGLAAGIGAAKLAGEGYKSFQRKAQMGALEERQNILGSKGEANLTADEKAELEVLKNEYNALRAKKSNVGRAMGAGIITGMTAGFTGGKFNLSGFNSGMQKANELQRKRADGYSFGRESKETISKFFGVTNEYGDFGEMTKELKDLRNKEQRYKLYEERAEEIYIGKVGDILSEFGLSDAQRDALNNGDISGIDQMITEQQAKVKDSSTYKALSEERDGFVSQYKELETKYKLAENIKNANSRKATLTDLQRKMDKVAGERDKREAEMNSLIENVETKFKEVESRGKQVIELDELHKKAKTKADKLAKQINDTSGKK